MKEADQSGLLLCDFNYITSWKRQNHKNYKNNKKISGSGGKGAAQTEHRGFLRQ